MKPPRQPVSGTSAGNSYSNQPSISIIENPLGLGAQRDRVMNWSEPSSGTVTGGNWRAQVSRVELEWRIPVLEMVDLNGLPTGSAGEK